jgi:hypothetical protein
MQTVFLLPLALIATICLIDFVRVLLTPEK